MELSNAVAFILSFDYDVIPIFNNYTSNCLHQAHNSLVRKILKFSNIYNIVSLSDSFNHLFEGGGIMYAKDTKVKMELDQWVETYTLTVALPAVLFINGREG